MAGTYESSLSAQLRICLSAKHGSLERATHYAIQAFVPGGRRWPPSTAQVRVLDVVTHSPHAPSARNQWIAHSSHALSTHIQRTHSPHAFSARNQWITHSPCALTARPLRMHSPHAIGGSPIRRTHSVDHAFVTRIADPGEDISLREANPNKYSCVRSSRAPTLKPI